VSFIPGLIGHSRIRQRLFERQQSDTIARALLFTGPSGIGKRRVAFELIQRELCVHKTACGVCPNCLSLISDLPYELPNMVRVVPEGKKGVIRIKQLREGLDSDDKPRFSSGVLWWAKIAPAAGFHRWVIIEDAHRLSEVGNILLKTLEEAPKGVQFILITHKPNAVLQTIRSRSEEVVFSALTNDEIWSVAKLNGWQEAEKESWLAVSEGKLEFLDRELFQNTVIQINAWLKLLSGGFLSDTKELIPKTSDLAQNEQLRFSFELLLRLIADVNRLKFGKEPSLAPWRKELKKLEKLNLIALQDAVFKAIQGLQQNPFPESQIYEILSTLR
jgi:DNA polymerase-3 subunit delta'